MTPLFRKILGLNWPLLFTMYGLLVFGVFAIESAAQHLVIDKHPEIIPGPFFANKQKMWILAGSAVYFVTALIDYRWYRWLALPMWVAGMGLELASHGVGETKEFGVSFQPAQIAIASGILILGWLLQDLPRLGRRIPRIGWIFEEPILKIAVIGAITGISFLVVMAKGDMGSAIVWIPLAGIALLISGVPFRYLSLMSLLAVALIPIAYFIVLPKVSERGRPRIETFLDMANDRPVDPMAEAYAAVHCRIAVGKAGWSGEGLNSTTSLHAQGFIPMKTAHTDYIFAVIAEAEGFRGSILLITSFGLLLVLCLFVGTYARDPMGRLIVGGVVAVFFAHIFENIGMCVVLMPITGIPLPLISYSGTFVVMCMFMLGLVQSVWVHRDLESLTENKEAAVA
jgi:rod shape determining protein RodA